MQEERQNYPEEPLFFDGQDEIIRDEPFELTGESAYRRRVKQAKKLSKLKQSGENRE